MKQLISCILAGVMAFALTVVVKSLLSQQQKPEQIPLQLRARSSSA